MRRRAALVVVCLLAACGGDDGDADIATPETTTTAAPETTTAATPEPEELYPDHTADLYADTTNWICHPDLADDPCRDIRTTEITSDGTTAAQDITPAAEPAFDCFYAYPTTSTDPDVNSDLSPDASEIDTVRAQVARYASVCRVFAPVYRSITLAGLGSRGSVPDAGAIAYGDVVDAWRTYVDELGDGRGVVLIGHSQGAGHLNRLLAEDVAPRPEVRSLLVSAVLLGTSVAEGALAEIPNCTSAEESGCLISYSSYPADQPPVDGALFGRPRDGGTAVCVDPVALSGGDGLGDVVLPTVNSLLGGVEGLPPIDTPYVAFPGAVETACATTGNYTYLAVARTGDDGRPLTNLLVQRLGPTWGLHLLDANLVQDDLIDVVTRQAEAHAGG
jgi:hypothetical protein